MLLSQSNIPSAWQAANMRGICVAFVAGDHRPLPLRDGSAKEKRFCRNLFRHAEASGSGRRVLRRRQRADACRSESSWACATSAIILLMIA